jgi:hypothetical protein
MSQRYILESVVSTHEILHDAIKMEKGLVLKLDNEKDYDRVNQNFPEEMMVTKGFGPKWRS